MTDLEHFDPITGTDVPDHPLFVVHNIERGDEMRNWSPNEALPAIAQLGRTALTINEGISWLIQTRSSSNPTTAS